MLFSILKGLYFELRKCFIIKLLKYDSHISYEFIHISQYKAMKPLEFIPRLLDEPVGQFGYDLALAVYSISQQIFPDVFRQH